MTIVSGFSLWVGVFLILPFCCFACMLACCFLWTLSFFHWRLFIYYFLLLVLIISLVLSFYHLHHGHYYFHQLFCNQHHHSYCFTIFMNVAAAARSPPSLFSPTHLVMPVHRLVCILSKPTSFQELGCIDLDSPDPMRW